jgi:phage terminase large subunit GpA-like protein
MGCEKLTAFVDVQERLLYYLVAAWRPDFTGFVIDYGTYPEQPTGLFTARDAPRTLKLVHQGAGLEGAIYAGLTALVDALVSREWPREDGVAYRIDKCLVDAGWQADVVYEFCRQSTHAAVLMPSHGAGIAASQKPISEYDRKRGDTIGEAWWIPASTRKRALRHLRIDTNWWKTFVYERLVTAVGDKGALTIFGTKPEMHRMLADHLCAEYRVRTAGQGRTLDEWKLPPHQPDNHWFDALVGAAACASLVGCRLGEAPTKRRKREDMRGIPLAERWRLARQRDALGGGF